MDSRLRGNDGGVLDSRLRGNDGGVLDSRLRGNDGGVLDSRLRGNRGGSGFRLRGLTGGFWIPAHTGGFRRARSFPRTPVIPAQAGIQRAGFL